MTAGATTLASLDYTRDDNGQLTGEDLTSLPGADSTYDYDPLERLTELNTAATWDYDDADNLLSTATGVDQVFNTGNQLCSTAPTAGTCTTPAPGATTYSYDNRGNRTTITPPSPTAATTLGYDQADRLTSVDTAAAAYSYNSDGLRTAKTVAGDTTTFTWDKTGGLPMLLVESLEGVDTHYLYGPGGQAYAEIGDDGTTTRYLHHDQIGSTRLITNPAGSTVATATYDAYGTPTNTTGTQSHLGYTGQYTDTETGYQYLRARYYDPTTGQFLTVDPLVASTGERHGYAASQPTNFVDPSGLFRIPGTNICVDIADPNCRSIKEQHPAGAQQVADGAAGFLDTVTGGNADRVLQAAGVDDRVRWESPAMQIGRVAGFVPAVVSPGGFIYVTTVGSRLNAVDTTASCLTGGGGRMCGVDSALAMFASLGPSGAGRALSFLGPDFTTASQLFVSVFATVGGSGWGLAKCG